MVSNLKEVSVFVILLFFVLLASLIVKNYRLQQDFFEKGVMYENEHKLIPAVDAYERVILAYIPFSSYNQEAIDKILLICDKLNSYDKLYCYETLRSALFQIQSFYQPYGELKEKITNKIIDLRTDLYIADLKLENKKEEIHKVMEEITKKEFNPDKFWSFLVPICLLGWIFSIMAGIWYRKPYFYGLGIVFFSLWLISLYMA